MKIRLPRMIIDTHCHGRDLKQSHKTTVRQTLLEAKNGLISTSVFMPNTDPPLIKETACAAYAEIMTEAALELSLPKQYGWFGLTDDNLDEFARALDLPWVVGGKIYPKGDDGKIVTTGTIGISKDETILEAMRLSRQAGKVTAYHCDDPAVIASEGNTINAEVTYVRKIIRLAERVPGVKIVICHVSCIESAQIILEAQKRYMNVALELCPHYLWFDADGINWRLDIDPIFYKCFNALRPKQNRLFLTALLARKDAFIIIGSDSAPHTREEKLTRHFGGLPSNQEMVPVICTLARELNLSDERVANLLSFNASHFLNIPVPYEFVIHDFEERLDEITYNNDVVENPWRGQKLLFPIRKKEKT